MRNYLINYQFKMIQPDELFLYEFRKNKYKYF